MPDPPTPAGKAAPTSPSWEAVLAAAGYELLEERPPQGIVRRFLTTQRHFAGTIGGGLIAWVRAAPPEMRGSLRFRLARLAAALARPFVDRSLAELPFPVQLRKRLERLGATYIKLGQILSLREDLLPQSVTEELKHLLDRLPALPYPRFAELVRRELERPIEEIFERIDPAPLGSASIGQIHRAVLRDGREVILKLVKPGIRETLVRDTVLLRMLGFLLQRLLPRVQPQRIIREFCDYTLREADLRLEADNAETFAANFRDLPDVVFPAVYREYSTRNLLCLELLEGIQPSAAAARRLSAADRDRIIDLGAAAIIRMLYRDGFFHADLHPANLLILEGPRAGFIDLGMVGRFSEEVRRTLLYYYYCLVMGDSENAARYLAALAEPEAGGDRQAFRREVEEICRRWHRAAGFETFSLGRLIMESVARGAQFRMYFPVEMVLMVKALVTFEGVGHLLEPDFDIAEVSRAHINRLFVSQFSPLRLAREGLRGAPELVDALVKAPLLVTESLRALEQAAQREPENPFAGLRGTVFAGFCLVAGAILVALHGPWPLWAALFALGVLLALHKGR